MITLQLRPIQFIFDVSSKEFTKNLTFNANTTFIDSKIPKNVLLLVNGKEISQDELKNISKNNIKSLNILKGESAQKKYGNKGKNGAIEISTNPNG